MIYQKSQQKLHQQMEMHQQEQDYQQELHYQQELLHYCELQHQRDQYKQNTRNNQPIAVPDIIEQHIAHQHWVEHLPK